MGYNSEVLLFLVEDKEQLAANNFENMDAFILYLKNSLYADKVTAGKNSGGEIVIKAHWSYTKWYDSYENIIEFNKILDNYPSEKFSFGRLGEEIGDFEEHGEYGSMWVNQDLCYDDLDYIEFGYTINSKKTYYDRFRDVKVIVEAGEKMYVSDEQDKDKHVITISADKMQHAKLLKRIDEMNLREIERIKAISQNGEEMADYNNRYIHRLCNSPYSGMNYDKDSNIAIGIDLLNPVVVLDNDKCEGVYDEITPIDNKIYIDVIESLKNKK